MPVTIILHANASKLRDHCATRTLKCNSTKSKNIWNFLAIFFLSFDLKWKKFICLFIRNKWNQECNKKNSSKEKEKNIKKVIISVVISKLWYRRKRVQVTQLKSAQLIVSLVAIIPVVNGTKITETKSERIKRTHRISRKFKKKIKLSHANEQRREEKRKQIT